MVASGNKFLISTVLFFTCVLAAQGQIEAVDDTTSTPIPDAGHDYIHMLHETVNPANGSVSIRIEVPVPKGRGITIPFSLNYDSNNVHHIVAGGPADPGYAGWQSNTGYLSQGGWNYSIPMVSAANWTETDGSYPNTYNCDTWSNYMFMDATGGQHALGLATQQSFQHGICEHGSLSVGSSGDPQVRASLPNIHTDPNNPQATPAAPVTVFTPDGTVYNFNPPTQFTHETPGPVIYWLPTTIEDRNGNIISVTDNDNGNFVIADTAGRTVISSNGFGPSGATNTLSVGGLVYGVVWTTTSARFTVPYQWVGNFPGPSSLGPNDLTDTCYSGIPGINDSQTVISQIILPNGRMYQFHYGLDNSDPAFQNPYGLLNEIDYPEGAWVRYTWKTSDTLSELANYPGALIGTCNGSYCATPVVDGCLYQYAAPLVAMRQVSFGGGSPSLTQTFSYNTSFGATGTSAATAWTVKTTQVVTTDNVQNQLAASTYQYSPITVSNNDPLDASRYPPQVPVESQILYYDFSGSLLRTVNKTWFNQYQQKSESVVENGLSTTKNYIYSTSAPWPQLIEEDDYDFGQSSPLRSTRTAYAVFPGTPGIIADRPCKTVVYDGSGRPASEMDYLYDGGTVICGNGGNASVAGAGGSALTGHDETNYGAGSTIPRGNPTAKIQRLFSGGASPTTTYTYDETGQITSVTDPNGNVTRYSYADQFVSTNTGSYTTTGGSPPAGKVTNAYLTQVTRPPTATTHIQSFTYGYNDGEVTTAIDENQQPTTYRYNDPLGRLTETDYADNGQVTLAYNDAAPNPSVTTTTKLTGTTNKVEIVVSDGVGHLIQTQLPNDPDGATTAETTYTGSGLVATRTNPHHSVPSATDGTTIYTYDALGRTKAVTKADGSSTHTTYASCAPNANAYGTTVTDEAGRARTTCTDALGRLTNVFEDPNGLNYETDYQYDALDNLLSVTQKGGSAQANWRTRSFVYDSLSRLLSAQNPESGTVLYGYDPNGNLVSKTDARGIQTILKYDALNRLTSKAYSDGTPTATFYYDTPPVPWGPGVQNTNGRLVEATTGITPEP